MPAFTFPQSHCRAAAARADVTPPVGIYHRMWGAATHEQSTGVHRPLTATVLALAPLDHSAPPLLIVSLDHCILADADVRLIRDRVAAATAFRPPHVHVALTHTHGAGLMMRDRAHLPGGELIAPYLDGLADTVARLAADAERDLRPAWLTFGVGRCDLAAHRDYWDAGANRYVVGFNPHDRADDTVVVARVTAGAGRTLATVVNYACHPTTLGWGNTLISPDYLGAMRETVESATGGVPCLFLQGASGELGPREGFVGDPAVADRNGRRLGYAALAALEALPPPGSKFAYAGAVVSGAVLGTWGDAALDGSAVAAAGCWRYRSWTIDLPHRRDLPDLASTMAGRDRLVDAEAAAVAAGDSAAARGLHAEVEQANRQLMRLAGMQPGAAFALPVTLCQIGPRAVLVAVAGEHYSSLQTTLRTRFPGLAIVVATVTDGWQPGYVPPADAYGKGIYQAEIATVAAGAAELVVSALAEQIAAWKGDAAQ